MGSFRHGAAALCLVGAVAMGCGDDGPPGESVEPGAVSQPITWVQRSVLNWPGTPQPYQEVQFGSGVAISGTTAVVGAPSKDAGNGAAYVFVRSPADWGSQQMLTNPTAGADYFGTAVAIDGDTIAVGAPREYVAPAAMAGTVHVYTRSGTTWSLQQSLVSDAPTGNGNFGSTVALSGNTLATTAKTIAHVFVRSGTTWSQQQKFVPSSYSVNSTSLSGDLLVLGMPGATIGPNASQGTAFVYTRSGTTWTQQQQLVAADGAANDYFGADVDIDGTTAMVGCPYCDVGGVTNRGAVYAYVRSGTSWPQQQKILPSDNSNFQSFGEAVAVKGNMMAATQTGNSAALYLFSRSGTSWTEQQKIASVVATRAEMDTGEVIAGYPLFDFYSGDEEENTGQAYIFVQVGASCSVAGDCASGYCSDNVCCDLLCGSACDVCSVAAGASADGFCTILSSGSTPSGCAAPKACNGSSATCAGSCASDLDCAAAYYCSSVGTCLARKNQGNTCNTADSASGGECKVSGCRVCTSGNCVDGYCCNTACGADCDVCSQSLGASANGSCTTAPTGTNVPGKCVSPQACNGVSINCPSGCATDSDCATTHYCDQTGTCVARKTQGASCNPVAGVECKVTGCRVCTTGNCVDGYCCDSACGGTCARCDAPSFLGSCKPLTDGATPETPGCGGLLCDGVSQSCPASCAGNGDCASTHYCDSGQCLLKACVSDANCAAGYYCANNLECTPRKVQGAACNAASGADCAVSGCRVCQSNSCVDGYCCNTACDTPCASCGLSGKQGTCSALADGATPDNPGCSGYLCDGSSLTCATTCAGNGDCATTHYCSGNSCLPSGCGSDNDCAADRYCDVNGACQLRKVQGQSCNAASGGDCMVGGCRVCQSNNCVDGFCCGTACTEPCASCGLSTKEGTCSPLADNAVPDAPGCAGYLCGGSTITCPTSCATDVDCFTTHYCAGGQCLLKACSTDNDCNAAFYCGADGNCKPRKATGNACNVAAGADCKQSGCRSCQTNNCVDGFCCNTTCTSECASCGLSGKQGTCSALADGATPETPGCSGYLCDGASLSCPSTCASGGDCATTHYCSGTSCMPNNCGSDTDCSADRFCDKNGLCQPRKATGLSCNSASGADCLVGGCRVCQSNNCVDGFCCATACTEPCGSCGLSTKEGTCSPLADNAMPDAPGCSGYLCGGSAIACPTTCAGDVDCSATHYCSGGQCLLKACSSDTDCAAAYYCASDGNCKLRKSTGNACSPSAGADCKQAGCRVCQSSNCVDGFCCNATCNEPCASCAGSTPGLCSPLADGTTPESQVCSGYLCDGAAIGCASSCASDVDCATTHFCNGGSCLQKKGGGESCTTSAQCGDPNFPFCADGVCCDTQCTGTCMACAAANKQSAANGGTCEAAKQGTNPNNGCIASGNVCGELASCSGVAGQCAKAPYGTTCGPTSCASNTTVNGKICDGTGTCIDQNNAQCAPYLCKAGACATPCTGDGDCTSGYYCQTGTCVAQSDNGKACAAANHCKSGFCVDTVCCDAPCGGQCQACAEPGSLGQCKTVTGTPRGSRPDCSGTGSCKGTCDGGNPTACAYASASVVCAAAQCTGDVSQPAGKCDGAGGCTVPATASCSPYGCDSTSGTCKTSCAGPGDCAQGALCDSTSGQCAAASATCADAYTVKLPDGQTQSCSPYKCVGGACQQQCSTSGDCAPGYDCAGTACVLSDAGIDSGTGGSAASGGVGGSGASGASGGAGGSSGSGTGGSGASVDGGGASGGSASSSDDSGGCGCRTPQRDAPSRAWLAMLAGLTLAARRRRRSMRG